MRLGLVLLGMFLAAGPRLLRGAEARSMAELRKAAWALDLNGRVVRQLAPPGTRAVVLFFTATDCPISNRYVPAMGELAGNADRSAASSRGHSGQEGVVLWWVYPNPSDTADVVRAHRLRYGIAGQALLDGRHTLVRMTEATVTPEAAILVPDARAGDGLRLVYHGRIDDRYAALGRERPEATHHDLADALRAALAGKRVPAPGGPPVGCAIMPLAP